MVLDIKWGKTRLYHVPLAGWSGEGGEDEDGSEKIPGGLGRVETTWLLVCR